MYVCLCKALTEGDIHQVVENVGSDLEHVQECCGVATDCGSCRFKAEAVIREAASKRSVAIAKAR